jgi:ubiquinol-cytochrome c reductase cytochrome b subunit
MQLGAKHVEDPFILFGQISTCLYFGHFVLIMPVVSLIENTLIDINTINKQDTIFSTKNF